MQRKPVIAVTLMAVALEARGLVFPELLARGMRLRLARCGIDNRPRC